MNRILNSKFLSIALLFLIFWLGNGFLNLNYQWENINKEIESYNEKISETSENNDKLAEFIKNIENPVFIEREVRIKYNYKKENEEVAFVYIDENKITSKSEEELLNETQFWFGRFGKLTTNWKRWWHEIAGVVQW